MFRDFVAHVVDCLSFLPDVSRPATNTYDPFRTINPETRYYILDNKGMEKWKQIGRVKSLKKCKTTKHDESDIFVQPQQPIDLRQFLHHCMEFGTEGTTKYRNGQKIVEFVRLIACFGSIRRKQRLV